MKKLTLAVLAAGMGSRFGGLKQTEKMDGKGHILLDYSLHDAILADFERVVFIIRKEMKDAFLSLVTSRRWYDRVDVELAFQELSDIPPEFSLPENRKKPWGTAHAISCLNGLVDSPFAVINADDFYGREAFYKIAKHLRKEENCMVAYKLKNTLSKYGDVSRGVCRILDGYLLETEEKMGIRAEKSIILDREGSVFSPETPVSMNLWGFNPEVIKESKERFSAFLKEKLEDDADNCEYTLPGLVSDLIEDGKIRVKVIETDAEWYGVTYKKDKSEVSLALEKMTNEGVYPIYL